MNKYYEGRREKVLTHYGNGKLACVRCGFDDIRALSIDHIDGGGSRHRKSLHKDFYAWLIENDYPLGYQTFCMNCQFITRGKWGGLRKLPGVSRRQTPYKVDLANLSASPLFDWVKPVTV